MKKNFIVSMMFLLTILGGPFMIQGLMIGTDNQSSNINTVNISEPSMNNVPSTTQGTQANVDSANTAQSNVRLQTSSQTAPIYHYTNYGTTVAVNATSYKPGQVAAVNMNSSAKGINGTISWMLLSPLKEPFFSFSNETTYSIFQNPTLISSTNDWENDPKQPFSTFTINSYNLTARLLTLGSTLTNITKPNRAFLNNSLSPITSGRYNITFQYNTSATSTQAIQLKVWNGGSYDNYNITPAGTTLSFLPLLTITVGNPQPSSSSYLGSQIYFSNAYNTTWEFTNFRMFHYLSSVNIYQPGNTTKITTSTLESFRPQNSEYKNNVTVTAIAYEDLINKTSFANFTISLPKYSLFLGDWQFVLIVNPVNQNGNKLSGATIIYRIPINITDQVMFNQHSIYMNRGFNTTTNLPIYVNETNKISVYSPNDSIVLLGSLVYTSTNVSFNSNYYGALATGTATTKGGYLFSNASLTNLKGLTWGNTGSIAPSSVKTFDKNGKTIADGNFTIANIATVNTTWGIDYKIPVRGIYGNVSNSLYLTFPNELTFDTNATPDAGNPYTVSINMGQIVVKFKTNFSAEELPFNRVYYLTELLQGSFNVTTTIYNTSLATIYAKNNVSAIINIPRSDLSFHVFLAENSSQQSAQDFIISLNQNTFVYNQKISSNLDIRNNYTLRINWNDALAYGDTNQGQMKFLVNNATEYPVSIQGTFNVELPTNITRIQQGTDLIINFNISIAQLQAPAKGLLAHGRVCFGNNTCSLNASSNINIVEQNGLFTAYYTVATNAKVGLYTLTIYSDYGMPLGNIEFVVIPNSIPSKNITIIPPTLMVYLGSLLILLVLVTFLGVIFSKITYLPKS